MKVQKFGGSILKNSQDIKIISNIILNNNNNSINVFSAFFNITDILIKIITLAKNELKEYEIELKLIENFHIKLCKELKIEYKFVELIFNEIKKSLDAIFQIRDFSNKTLDSIIIYGELLSSQMIYQYLKQNHNNYNIEYIDARDIIITDSNFCCANVDTKITKDLIKKTFKNNKIYIISGFIGSDCNKYPTTLGRNGSDFTAALIGSILNIKEVVIWKDVDGVFTADPKIVTNAIQIDKISYTEMAELSYFGSKVICLKAIYPAIQNNIPIIIRNIYNQNNAGTVISNQTNEQYKIKGIAKIDDISCVILNHKKSNLLNVNNFYKKIFNAIDKSNVEIIFFLKSSSDISITFGVKTNNEKILIQFINDEFSNEIKDKSVILNIKNKLSIISIVGYGLLDISGIAGKMFNLLEKAQISIPVIIDSFSDINIAFAINTNNSIKAIKLLHYSLFENKQINCLIAGNGVIGTSAIKMIQSQKEYFMKKGINMNIVGVFNDTKYINYIDKTEEKYNNFDEVIIKFKENADINYALIDCTFSDLLVENYQKFIKSGFNIVTPNKQANTLNYNKFAELQECLAKNKKFFFYETNVCAGLPIVSTIKDLLDCGDEIIKIEVIFSGTLSYIFKNLSIDKKFTEIVKKARNKDLIESNLKDDLSGNDIARKLLILARIIGYKLNLSDIKIQNLSNITDEEISLLNQKANKNNEVIRYIGVIENNEVFAKLVFIANDNPLALTQYTDNIISITTKFYNKTPLVMSGFGTGSDLTAIGIISDLIKLVGLI